jgi:rhodanese-related sulfurtransferase
MTSQPGIPTVDVREAETRMRAEEPALIVDVRNLDEFHAARIDGAVLVPLPELPERFSELPADRPLLMVCRSGSRSAAAAAFLLRNGFQDVANVAGGMDAWQVAGFPTRRGELDPGEGELG